MKMNPIPTIGRLALTGIGAALVTLVMVQTASATPIETDQNQAGGTYTIPTTNDLLLGTSPTSYAGDPTAGGGFFGGSNANLTDGSFSTGAAAGNVGGGALTSLTFNLGANPTGYNLSSLDTYTSWGDSGRYQQSYTVLYSLASDPSTFLTLYTVNPYPSSTFGANQAHVNLTDSTGLLASNVAMVQFQFGSTENGWSGYQELVVTGVAAAVVPEPSTWAMLFGGVVCLMIVQRSRRHRQF